MVDSPIKAERLDHSINSTGKVKAKIRFLPFILITEIFQMH